MPVDDVVYLSTLDFDDDWLATLRAGVPEVTVHQVTATATADLPADLLARATVLHTSSVFPSAAEAPRLAWVQLDTSGVDHVRGSAVWEGSVELTTIGGVSPQPLAEYVIFAILGFAHRLPALLAAHEHRTWPTQADRFASYLPAPVPGATVGIVGYGRIGAVIARLARAHGMNVVAVNRSGTAADDRPAEPGEPTLEVSGPDGLPDLLARSDYLVVVVPLTDETRGLIGRKQFELLKPGAVVVNVARGGIVDEDALWDALADGRVAGAMLDVFDDEPLPPDSRWWDHPRVFATPHVAGLAPAYRRQVLELVIDNLRRFVHDEPLRNRVDRARGY